MSSRRDSSCRGAVLQHAPLWAGVPASTYVHLSGGHVRMFRRSAAVRASFACLLLLHLEHEITCGLLLPTHMPFPTCRAACRSTASGASGANGVPGTRTKSPRFTLEVASLLRFLHALEVEARLAPSALDRRRDIAGWSGPPLGSCLASASIQLQTVTSPQNGGKQPACRVPECGGRRCKARTVPDLQLVGLQLSVACTSAPVNHVLSMIVSGSDTATCNSSRSADLLCQEGDTEEIAKCPRNCHGEPICARGLGPCQEGMASSDDVEHDACCWF